MARDDKFKKSYHFLSKQEQTEQPFTLKDLSDATGWTESTVRTYLAKKWKPFVVVRDDGFYVDGISDYTEDQYIRLMSQRQDVSASPKRPIFDLPPENRSSFYVRIGRRRRAKMPRKRYSPEEIIHKLREAEILLSQGLTVKETARQLEIAEQTYYRWRKDYGGMDRSQARHLKELERENARLKKLVADLSLDKAILEEALSKK